MKFLIASDLHGDAVAVRALLDAYKKEGADKLVLLGDVLYHGPRNDLPAGYAPKEVIALLNAMKGEILCVRGNCDTEVDQMVLEFPILADYAVIALPGGGLAYLSHGHHFNAENPPLLGKDDVLLHGHSHLAGITRCATPWENPCLNPGSVSIPKGGTLPSYILLENGVFTLKSLKDGQKYAELETK